MSYCGSEWTLVSGRGSCLEMCKLQKTIFCLGATVYSKIDAFLKKVQTALKFSCMVYHKIIKILDFLVGQIRYAPHRQ